MSLLAGAVAVVLLAAAGWWPMRRLAGAWAGPGRLELAAVAIALGAALVGLAQVALSACGVAAGVGVPVALAALSLLLCRLLPGDERAAPAPRLPPPLAVLLVAVAVLSVGAAVGAPFSADGIRIWAAKARDLVLTGAADAPSLHDPERLGVHRHYPLLVPSLLAPVFAWTSPFASAGPKLVLAALNLALLGTLTTLLRRCGRRGMLLLAAAATAPFLFNADVRESAVAGGYADSVDALFLLLVVVALQRLRDSVQPARAVALLALAGAALLSTKLEGAVELSVAVAAACLTSRPRVPALTGAALALVLAAPTFVIQAGVVRDSLGFEPSALSDAGALLARSVPVAAGLTGLLVDASSFALLPLLLLLGLLAPVPPERRALRRFVALMLAATLVFLFAAYLTTWMVASRHVYTSAHRLLWHWLPAVTWLVARLAAPAGGAVGAERVRA